MAYWRLNHGTGTFWTVFNAVTGPFGPGDAPVVSPVVSQVAGADSPDAGSAPLVNPLNGGEGLAPTDVTPALYTGAADDTVEGSAGADKIYAGEGANVIFAGAGHDTVSTGGGADLVMAISGNNRLLVGAGENTLRSGDGHDTIAAGHDADEIDAGGGNNWINAGGGDNAVTTGSGNDTVRTGAGDDTIEAGDGHNRIFAGAGDNTVTTGKGHDHIHAAQGADVIDAGAGNNRIMAGNGDNAITSGHGLDIIYAGTGDDAISSGAGRDWIHAGGGNNVIDAGAGHDVIYTLGGNSTVSGGAGDNLISVGRGQNVIRGGAGDDTILGHEGTDSVILDGNLRDFRYDLAGQAAVTQDWGAVVAQVAAGQMLHVTDLRADGGKDALRHVDVLVFDDVTVYLDGRNTAPVVTAAADQQVDAGETVDFALGALDLDGSAVRLVSLTVDAGVITHVGTQVAALGGQSFALRYDTDGIFADLVVGAEAVVTVTAVLEDAQGARTTEDVAITVAGTAPVKTPVLLPEDSFVFETDVREVMPLDLPDLPILPEIDIPPVGDGPLSDLFDEAETLSDTTPDTPVIDWL